MERLAEILELAVRALCDELPKKTADGAYLYSETIENQSSVLVAAGELITKNIVKMIVLPGSPARCGYPGQDVWNVELLKAGISADRIACTEASSAPLLHTRSEAEALMQLAKAKAWKSILVVAPSFHQLRAFMTTVSVALDVYPEISVYSYPGKFLPWDEEVTHSQGKLRGKRREFIYEELKRIETYMAKGDLRPLSDIVDYLNRRSAVGV